MKGNDPNQTPGTRTTGQRADGATWGLAWIPRAFEAVVIAALFSTCYLDISTIVTSRLIAATLAFTVSAVLLTTAFIAREPIARLVEAVQRLLGARGETRAFVALVVLGLVLRLGWLAVVPTVQASDAAAYFDLATRLVDEGRYATVNTRAFWPPGLPFALAATMSALGKAWWIPAFDNLIWFVALAWIARALAIRMGAAGGALFVVAILAIWPSSIFASGIAAKELMLAFLLPLSFLMYIRASDRSGTSSRWAAGAGLVLGFATLTQPKLIAEVGVIGLYELARGAAPGTARRLAALVLGLAVVVLPWTVRNYRVLGAFVPVSTNGGSVMFMANNDKATGRHVPVPTDIRLLDEVTGDREARGRAVRWILENPGRVITLMPMRQMLYLGDESLGAYSAIQSGLGITDWRYAAARAVSSAFWLALLCLLLLSIARARERGTLTEISLLPMLSFLVSLALLSAGISESSGRFHVPLVAGLAALAAIGFFARTSPRPDS